MNYPKVTIKHIYYTAYFAAMFTFCIKYYDMILLGVLLLIIYSLKAQF